jgi:uncharacterized protein (UPF0332 family)
MPAQPFDWLGYHKLAEELLQQAAEPHLRTAVSRAYYYVFHLGRQRLIANRFYFIEKQDSHKQVWEKFADSPDPRCKKLAETAKRLKQKREVADYEQYFPRIEEDAVALVALAGDFARQLLGLDPRLPQNTGVMRT